LIDNFAILVCGVGIVLVIFRARQRHMAQRTDMKPPPSLPQRLPSARKRADQ
jgi:hypothetical protein